MVSPSVDVIGVRPIPCSTSSAQGGFHGRDSATGSFLGRAWRDAGESFSYQLSPRREPAAEAPLALQLELFEGEWSAAMEVRAGGRLLASVVMDGKGADDFGVRTLALPPDLAEAARHQGLRVDFLARDGRRTPRLFGLRLLEAGDAGH